MFSWVCHMMQINWKKFSPLRMQVLVSQTISNQPNLILLRSGQAARTSLTACLVQMSSNFARWLISYLWDFTAISEKTENYKPHLTFLASSIPVRTHLEAPLQWTKESRNRFSRKTVFLPLAVHGLSKTKPILPLARLGFLFRSL